MATKFVHLNLDWNAEPNAPEPQIKLLNTTLYLEFFLNPWAYENISEQDRGIVEFTNCKRYRLGKTNDEGFYLGQCRFSHSKLKWGEFYEIQGDSKFEDSPNDWITNHLGSGQRHFLFYFRDDTFECEASDFSFRQIKV